MGGGPDAGECDASRVRRAQSADATRHRSVDGRRAAGRQHAVRGHERHGWIDGVRWSVRVGGRGGTAGAAGAAGGTAGAAGAAGARRPPGGGPESTGPAGTGSGTGEPPPRGRRAANKATLGSTSYDGADAEPFEPDWGGASWYGTSSGTYWTLNPKEYADPRKHGPEYQARARRKARTRPIDPLAAAAGGAAASDPDPDVDVDADDAPDPAAEPAQPPIRTTSTWWAAGAANVDDGPTPAASGSTRIDPAPPSASSATAGPGARSAQASAAPVAGELESTTVSIREWLEGGDTGLAGRVGRAVIGWAPLALGIGWLAGELSGCARFSAACDGGVAPLSWLAQLGVLLVLLLVPRLATIATVATAVTLAAAVPGTLLLTAAGGATDTATGRDALGGLLVIAWVLGVALGVARELRRSEPAPVS